MSEYKDIPTIPIELSIRNLDQFYRVVGILNRTCGKNKWKGPKGIVKKLRAMQDNDRYPLRATFWVFDGYLEQINMLIKLSI